MPERFPNLLKPLRVGSVTLKHRMLSAPTSLAELGPEEHYSRENLEYYKLRAFGGAAVVPVGDVIVELDTGRSHPQQAGMNDPAAAPYFCALADAIHSGGALAEVELDHGGALCSPEFLGGKNAVGPSGYIDPWGDEVTALDEEQLFRLAERFAEGAGRAKEYGFDLVMLHAGHGWLLHQFLSPITNRRKDRWGGALENRLRFPLLVIEKMRAAVGPSFPIDVRISGTEYAEGGYGLAEGIEIARALDGSVDLLHVSAGTQQEEYSAVLMHPGAFQRDMHNAYLAAEIKKHVKTPVISVGAFNLPEDMERFLAETGVDGVALGRALIADPFLPRKVLEGRPEDIRPCLRCGECQSGMMRHGVMRCSVNPSIGRECEVFHPLPVYRKKKVLIAGSGPAGMEAALQARARGHAVVLCESAGRLGALSFADNDVDFKKPIRRYRESQIARLERSGAELRLNTRVDRTVVEEVRPDVLIAAVGGEPAALPVPGAEGRNVVFGAYITPETRVGGTVAVVGGGYVGCEEAAALAEKGHDVTVLELRDTLAAECGRMHRIALMHAVETNPRITAVTGVRCTRIDEGGVYAVNVAGDEVFYPCDTVVIAAGMRSRAAEVEALRPLVREFYVIGDARRPGKIMNATRDAYDAVTSLGFF